MGILTQSKNKWKKEVSAIGNRRIKNYRKMSFQSKSYKLGNNDGNSVKGRARNRNCLYERAKFIGCRAYAKPPLHAVSLTSEFSKTHQDSGNMHDHRPSCRPRKTKSRRGKTAVEEISRVHSAGTIASSWTINHRARASHCSYAGVALCAAG